MTFKLRIKGRDHFESSFAANPANPLILTEQDEDFPGFAANDDELVDLTQHTISRLAGLAGLAIEKEAPYPCLSDDDLARAGEYHEHHFKCPDCIAAGQGRGLRCGTGTALWSSYQNTAIQPTKETP